MDLLCFNLFYEMQPLFNDLNAVCLNAQYLHSQSRIKRMRHHQISHTHKHAQTDSVHLPWLCTRCIATCPHSHIPVRETQTQRDSFFCNHLEISHQKQIEYWTYRCERNRVGVLINTLILFVKKHGCSYESIFNPKTCQLRHIMHTQC